MNKDILNQLTADEQNAALEEFVEAAETMKVTPTFRWDLETQLMGKYRKPNNSPHMAGLQNLQ